MKGMLCTTLAMIVACASAVEVTPVQKVIQLLTGMREKGKAEKHDEQVQFAAYKQFCEDTTAEKSHAIEVANERIEVLQADIQKATVDAAQLAKEIAGHQQDIWVWKADIKAATSVRKIDKADYDNMHTDYTESVDAINMALVVLKKQNYDRPQALIQVSTLKNLNLIPQEAKRAIDAFLTEDTEGDELSVTAPEANSYESRSGGIIEMLEKLLDEFIEKRTQLEKEEMNSVHAFEMLMQDLQAQIEQAQHDIDEKSGTKAKTLEFKAGAEGDLADTTASRDADAKYLADLTATCNQKESDFSSRQQLRAEEIEAINTAIEILSSAAVSGNAAKHLPTLLQTKKAALAQLRAAANSPIQSQVASYLQERARQLDSRVLSALAAHVADDPFTKVKKMILDLIRRLMEEANQEAEHKGWCDTELSTNEQTRQEKTSAVETLNSEIDELQASIAKLTEEIADLSNAVAALDQAMEEATDIRGEEKAKNAETVTDAQDAQTAVAQALTVLQEFYQSAGGATALVQQPAIFDAPYQGMQAENGGVTGMLEVIESDFARLESDTLSAEATSQKEYEEFMSDSKVDRSSKTTESANKERKKGHEQSALVEQKANLEMTQKELDTAMRYFDKLKPSCVDSDVNYEDRVAQRKEEIDSLKKALGILKGKTVE